MSEGVRIRWAPRVKPRLIQRLYEADAAGLSDAELIDEVGVALLARCETIRRVTERRCPECGDRLEGAWANEPRDRPITCPGCRWTSTWRAYHHSYKGERIHGGSAYEDFLRFLREFPSCRTARARMLVIDRLIHAVHETVTRIWTSPAASNLIAAKREEVVALLDGLAYGDQVDPERADARRGYLERMAASEGPTGQHREQVRQRHARAAARKSRGSGPVAPGRGKGGT